MFKNKPNLGTMREKSLNLSMYLGLVSSALAQAKLINKPKFNFEK